MALQSTDACISQKGQPANQVAERMLVLLSQQTSKWHTAQRGERTLRGCSKSPLLNTNFKQKPMIIAIVLTRGIGTDNGTIIVDTNSLPGQGRLFSNPIT